MKKSLFVLSVFISTLFSYNFTPSQIKTLKTCVKISKTFNNDPSLVCGILLNETAAGKTLKQGVGDRFLKPFDRSYGVMQVRFRTCKSMINRLNIKLLKKMPDEKILVHLIEDEGFNIAMANVYISYLRKKYKDSLKKVVIAYNSGYYNPKNTAYWKRFLKNRRIYYEFVRKYGEE